MMPSTRLSRFLHAHLLPLGISAVLLALAGIGSLTFLALYRQLLHTGTTPALAQPA